MKKSYKPKSKKENDKTYLAAIYSRENGHIEFRARWKKGEAAIIGELLASLHTRSIVPYMVTAIEEEAVNMQDVEGIQAIHQIIEKRVAEQEQLAEDEPLIDPLYAIRHHMTMYQNRG